MRTFSYTAVDEFGREVRGNLSADDERALADRLREQGQYLVRAAEATVGRDLANVRILEWVNRQDVILFTAQLATMVATGVGLVEGLADIEAQVTKPVLKRVVAAVKRDIESGQSLSQALAHHPKVFSELYLNIVRAGEATGTMEHALQDLVDHLEWQAELNARIREAATYPAIVVVLLVFLSIVLVGYTIPRFLETYQQLHANVELPLPSQAVLGVSNIVRGHGLVLLPALLVAFVGLNLYAQSPAGRLKVSRLVLRIPIVGTLVRKVALSRFAHYFGSLHEAGLEVAPSLEIVERLIGNHYLASRFRLAVDRVMAGESLSGALQAVGEFPPLVIQMIALGERTGRMPKALQDVRRYFDREIDRSIKRAMSLVGPIMLVVLALVFVTMALAFYLPLFRLLSALQ